MRGGAATYAAALYFSCADHRGFYDGETTKERNRKSGGSVGIPHSPPGPANNSSSATTTGSASKVSIVGDVRSCTGFGYEDFMGFINMCALST